MALGGHRTHRPLMERLALLWIGRGRSKRQVRGTNQGGGKLVLSTSVLMDSHIEDTVPQI